jgi:hypothetical protein
LTPDLVGPSITKNAGIIGEDVELSLEHLGDPQLIEGDVFRMIISVPEYGPIFLNISKHIRAALLLPKTTRQRSLGG